MSPLLPSPRQTRLLRAGLLDGEAALAAWRGLDLPADLAELPAGEGRLLPLVSSNLARLGHTHPDQSRLEELRRHSWGRNLKLARQLEEVAAALLAADVPPVLLKGAALAPAAYPDLGARPMADLDLLVTPDQVDRALDALAARGFQAAPEARDRARRRDHALELRRPGDAAVDLHWAILKYSLAPGHAEALVEAAEPAASPPGALRLAPADQLLHSLVDGLARRRGAPDSAMWAADAARLLATQGPALDWDLLVTRTRHFRVAHLVALGLGYLADALDQPVPDRVRQTLASMPTSWPEALEAQVKASPRLQGLALPSLASYYLRRQEARGQPVALADFAGFLADWAGVEGPRDLPGALVRRLFEDATSGCPAPDSWLDSRPRAG